MAEALRDWAARRITQGLTHQIVGAQDGSRPSAISYLGHVGFFTRVGTDYGKQPGEAPGSPTYVPITVLSRDALPSGVVLQKAIDLRAQELAALIFEDGSQRDMLQYCLREVIRNVFEHAKVHTCTLMAQRYRDGDVEIAIADLGIGVLASLSETHRIQVPGQALKLAIKPGVSRVQATSDSDQWGNSGFGLYVLSRLGMQTGAFRLVSSGMSLEMSGSINALGPAHFPGTAIGLRVSTRNAEYFPNLLQQLVAEGERASGASSGSVPRRASMMTLKSGNTAES